MYNYKIIVSLLIFAYCFGNISPAIILSKLVLKSDIRSHGSGNAGATNVKRVMGSKFGVIVFVLDMLKGFIPALLGLSYSGPEIGYLCGIAVVLGHVFPIFLHFKGGKGVATSFGAALILNPIFALISISVFTLIVWQTKYVSLGSMIGTCVFPLLNLITGKNRQLVLLSLVFAIVIIVAHRGNIKKLLDQTESKISR